MFKIRSAYFETNSSSMDKYDDYEDKYPTHAFVPQIVHIFLQWNDDVTDSRVNEIMDAIENDEISNELEDIFIDYYDNFDEIIIDSCDEDIINLTVKDCTVELEWSGKYYPATRYEPAEEPDMDIVDNDGIPEKNEKSPEKSKIIQQLRELFAKKGWTEIIDVSDVYSDSIEYDDVWDALDL